MCWLLSLAHNTPFTEYRVHKRDIPRRYVYLLMQFNFLFIFIPFFLQIVFLRSSILTSETSGRQRRRKKLKNSETEACLCCEWNDNKNVNGAQLCVSSALGLDSRRPLSVFTFFFLHKSRARLTRCNNIRNYWCKYIECVPSPSSPSSTLHICVVKLCAAASAASTQLPLIHYNVYSSTTRRITMRSRSNCILKIKLSVI